MRIRSHSSEHSCHFDGIDRSVHDTVYNRGLYVLTRKGEKYNFSCSVEVHRLVVIGVVNGIVAAAVAVTAVLTEVVTRVGTGVVTGVLTGIVIRVGTGVVTGV